MKFLNQKKQDIFQATFSKFLLHLYSILSKGVCVCLHECVVKHVFVYVCVFVCIESKLEDLAKETNLQVQFNVISMLGMKLVTTPPFKKPSPIPLL